MKETLNISMGDAADNFDETVVLLGEKVRVKRLGVDFNHALAKQLILKYADEFDSISISGLPTSAKARGFSFEHPQAKELLNLSESTPIVDGRTVRGIQLPWAINTLMKGHPEVFQGKKIGFFLACSVLPLLKELESADCSFYMADPYFLNKLPLLLREPRQLENYMALNFPLLKKVRIRQVSNRDFGKKRLRHLPAFKRFFECDTFILNNAQLAYINLPDLTGKTVVVDYLTDSSREKLKQANVKAIYACSVTNQQMPFAGHAM